MVNTPAYINIDIAEFPLDPKKKQLEYISGFASIGYIPAIKPYLPHALRAGATKDEILSAYLASIPKGHLIHALPALKEVSDSVDEIIHTSVN
jgi:alkylhydroperoxidase/carboxymuconolactone decarboxylase family protein YurZ